MQKPRSLEMSKYILIGAIGAFLGGAVVLVASDSMPKMMSRMMSEMMTNMMTGVGEDGCSPAET